MQLTGTTVLEMCQCVRTVCSLHTIGHRHTTLHTYNVLQCTVILEILAFQKIPRITVPSICNRIVCVIRCFLQTEKGTWNVLIEHLFRARYGYLHFCSASFKRSEKGTGGRASPVLVFHSVESLFFGQGLLDYFKLIFEDGHYIVIECRRYR